MLKSKLNPLIVDKWGDDLVTLREFPFLKSFYEDSKHILKEHHGLLEKLDLNITSLYPNCREWGIHESLQALGIFEFTVEIEGEVKQPSEAQCLAIDDFIQNEKGYSHCIGEALLKYYKSIKAGADHLFEDIEIEASTVEELGQLIKFDGIQVYYGDADGYSPIKFSFSPLWDNHGLSLLFYRGGILMIGGYEEVNDCIEYPESEGDGYFWKRKLMSEIDLSKSRLFNDYYMRYSQ